MSTRSETYLIFGVKLDPKKCYEEEINESLFDRKLFFPYKGKGAKNTIGILLDGMGSNFALVGKCLDFASDEGDGFELTSMATFQKESYKITSEVCEFIRQNNLFNLTIQDDTFDIHLVTNYH